MHMRGHTCARAPATPAAPWRQYGIDPDLKLGPRQVVLEAAKQQARLQSQAGGRAARADQH
jgi:hypothetical protein